MTTRQCSIPASVLIGAPFNLPWGSTIRATVTAINAVGSSLASLPGGNGIILTYPDPPVLLANLPQVTNFQQIGITW